MISSSHDLRELQIDGCRHDLTDWRIDGVRHLNSKLILFGVKQETKNDFEWDVEIHIIKVKKNEIIKDYEFDCGKGKALYDYIGTAEDTIYFYNVYVKTCLNG